MEVFLATILLWPCNFYPAGWLYCDGSLLSIAQNQALFALLGTTFGGNGTTTFALPDLRGRVPVGAGSGPGLSARTLGEISGSESVTILPTQMPAHTHTVTIKVSNAQATDSTPTPTINSLAAPYDTTNFAPIAGYNNQAPNTALNIGTPPVTGVTGGSLPTPIMQPYLVLNYIIATQGIFPSRG